MTPEIDCDACFSPDYATARARFVAASTRRGGVLQAYENPVLGPAGEALITNTAWFGPTDASRVLVLVSGTRGVDGFCGAAAQLDWIGNGGPGALPGDIAVLMIHAINPYGFAWLRRVTEEGADLNRNWVDFNRPLPENKPYDELADVIVPAALDGPAYAAAVEALATWRDKHGEHAFHAALHAGQFKHAHGLYYGGAGPTWARRTLETIIEENRLALRDLVAVIDVQIGIGAYGAGGPICGHTPGTAGDTMARQWYGDCLSGPFLAQGSDPRPTTAAAAAVAGLSQLGWSYELGDRVTFIALEFGTYDPQATFRAQQADHWLHAGGDVSWASPETQQIKRQLRQAFYPDQEDWHELVLFRSRQVFRQAIAGLASEGGPSVALLPAPTRRPATVAAD